MAESTLVLLLLGLVVFLLASEILRVDVVSLGAMVTLAVLGIVPPEVAFAGFANPALLTVAAMFVLSGGLNRTGALAFVADRIIHFSRGGARRLLLLLMVTAAVMSAFMNNTTVVVIFIPVVIAIAQEFGSSPSRLLLPLSYASIVGGTCTLIGTSTNLLISALAVGAGLAPLGMFELAPLGLIFVLVGVTYMMTVGRRLIPERRPVSLPGSGGSPREYMTEVAVGRGSALIGRPLKETFLAQHPELTVLQVVRGEAILWPPLDRLRIRAGDVLMVRGKIEDLVSVHSVDRLEILPELARGQLHFDPKAATLAEVIILPNSPLVGQRVGDAHFRRLHGVTVMALQRRGAHFRDKVTQMDLRPGDIILLYGDETAIAALGAVEDFIVLGQPRPVHPDRSRGTWALGILAGVVLLTTLGVTSILVASMIGALAMVLSGCLPAREAYDTLDMKVLVLIAGALALGEALQRSGTAALVAGGLLEFAGPLGPLAMLAGVYLLTMVTTELLSNNAAAVLLFPVALSAATALSVSPRPFLIAVTFAASASFSTPIGYQTNTLVYGAGGYRFSDFLRVGPPLSLLLWLAAMIFIPMIWSF